MKQLQTPHHTKRRVRRYITRVVAPLFLYLPSWKGLSLFLCEYGWVPIVPTVYALPDLQDRQSLLLGSKLQLTIQGFSLSFQNISGERRFLILIAGRGGEQREVGDDPREGSAGR